MVTTRLRLCRGGTFTRFWLPASNNMAHGEPAEEAIEEDLDPSGYLHKQEGPRGKSWKKAYFVMAGMRLRWYDTFESFVQSEGQAPKGDITCAQLSEPGPRLVCFHDARTGKQIIVRSDMGYAQCCCLHACPSAAADRACRLIPRARVTCFTGTRSSSAIFEHASRRSPPRGPYHRVGVPSASVRASSRLRCRLSAREWALPLAGGA